MRDARACLDGARRAHASGNYALARSLFDDADDVMGAGAAGAAGGARARATARANASACALALGETEDALRRAEGAIAMDGTYAKAHARRAAALRAKREFARARESLRTCGELLARDGSEAMMADLEAMVMEIDKEEAAGAQAARVGMQMQMGTATQTKPSFRVESTTRETKRVTFDPKLEIDCDDIDDVVRVPSKRAPSKPMLMELGVFAVEKVLEMPPRVGAESKEETQYKRCRMCGNVCHAKLSTCSSCCLPLVSPESYEPATLPRVGDDAGTYESDSSDEEEATPTHGDAVESEPAYCEEDPWWVQFFTRRALESPKHAIGRDPALQSSYDALHLPLGADELAVRAAYQDAVARSHPDAGGSTKELRTIHRAYDAISQDFWRHDEGAERLREHCLDGRFVEADNENIFVVLDVYRNREAEHTLKRLFSEATHPERVFVGVTWQYKTTTPPPDELGARIDRLHVHVNVMTNDITEEAIKIKDGEEQEKYLKKMRRWQLKAQREEDAEERRCHSRKVLDAQFREHVREVQMPWDASEGPSYAKHLAMRKWGGEKYVLHIDAMTRVDKGWDETLISELSRCGDAKAVLTAAPLAYELERRKVIEEETFRVKYETHVYGTTQETLPAVDSCDPIDPSRAPAITCAREFGDSLCYMNARQLSEAPQSPAPTLFFNTAFAFARAEAFVRDAPPDPHAPFLQLGEEMSATARLWTRGWNLFAPSRVPLLHCYSTIRRAAWTEDRRDGKMLYAEKRFAIGNESAFEQREFLNLLARRRVMQLVGAPDENSATSNGEPVEFTRTYGDGDQRSIDAFGEHVGVDFKTREVRAKAKNGGAPSGTAFNAKCASLPGIWRGKSIFLAGVGPNEYAR